MLALIEYFEFAIASRTYVNRFPLGNCQQTIYPV